jgi:hypothetical protein
MLYKVKVGVCSEIRTKHSTQSEHYIELLDLGTRRGWWVSVTSRSPSTPGKEPVPIVEEVGWTPGPIWTGAENLSLTGIRSPDGPTRSQSLYRLN